jgi:hypothetical protein
VSDTFHTEPPDHIARSSINCLRFEFYHISSDGRGLLISNCGRKKQLTRSPLVGAHSTRGLVASWAEIFVASWASPHIFMRFYRLDVTTPSAASCPQCVYGSGSRLNNTAGFPVQLQLWVVCHGPFWLVLLGSSCGVMSCTHCGVVQS